MSTAAVVVTMNREALLQKCIQALKAEDVDEILVIDNGDGGPVQDAIHVPTPDNIGPAGGFAVGISMAVDRGHGMLWLFNDDDQCLHGSRRTLQAAFDAPDIAAVGSRISRDGEIRDRGAIWTGRTRPPSWNATHAWVDVTTFSGLMLSVRAVRSVGLPRADLFMMFEEHEYCLRLREAGYRIKILAEPQTSVIGLGSDSPQAGWREYYRARNHLRVALDRKSPREVGWWAVRQMRLLVASRRKSMRTHLRYASKGWIDGIRGRMGRTVEPAD